MPSKQLATSELWLGSGGDNRQIEIENPNNYSQNVPNIENRSSLKRCEKKMSTMYGSELVKPFKSGALVGDGWQYQMNFRKSSKGRGGHF